MTDAAPSPPREVTLTNEQIARWEADVRILSDEIEERIGKRDLTIKRIEAARFLIDSQPAEIPQASAELTILVEPALPVQVATPRQIKRRRYKRATWTDVVLSIVNRAEMGLTYADVRAQAAASELGERLKESDKGYHNAIGRLAREGTIVREYGRLFTPGAHRRFMLAVDRGEASTTVAMPFAHSPMGEAILRIVWSKPGMIGKEIISELRKDVEFNATLTPHETGAYNIIARLVKRRQIIRRDDGGCIPGPDFPRSELGLTPERDRALNGKAASALVAGEVAASPTDNQPALRLIG